MPNRFRRLHSVVRKIALIFFSQIILILEVYGINAKDVDIDYVEAQINAVFNADEKILKKDTKPDLIKKITPRIIEEINNRVDDKDLKQQLGKLHPEFLGEGFCGLDKQKQSKFHQQIAEQIDSEIIVKQFLKLAPAEKNVVIASIANQIDTKTIGGEFHRLKPTDQNQILSRITKQIDAEMFKTLPEEEREAILRIAGVDRVKFEQDFVEEQQNKILKKLWRKIDTAIIEDQFLLLEKEEQEKILQKTGYGLQDFGFLMEQFLWEQYLSLFPEECDGIARQIDPYPVGVIPIIDWLNTVNLNSFFQPTLKNALLNRGYFNEFNSFDQINVWIEPFGFSTHFQQEKSRPLHFDLFTIGAALGGEYAFFERLVLGLGSAYTHSDVEWKDKKGSIATINSFYLGPALSYLFTSGYISCMVFGAVNLYEIQRSVEIDAEEIKLHDHPTSIDIACRLEGGISASLGGDFFIYPNVKIDYLHVVEMGTSQEIDEETNLVIESLHDSFLRAQLALKFTWEFFHETLGFFIPSLSIGWQRWQLLAIEAYQYNLDGCDRTFSGKVPVKPWNEPYVAAGFSFIDKRAILVSLNYEISLGEKAPTHAWSCRVALSW